MPMNRSELAEHVAYDFAEYEYRYTVTDTDPFGDGIPLKLVQLDDDYVRSIVQALTKSGRYAGRKDFRYVDWAPVARQAKRKLPYARHIVKMSHEEDLTTA